MQRDRLRDPLWHFLALGALLFAVDVYRSEPPAPVGEELGPATITVPAGYVDQARNEALARTGRAREGIVEAAVASYAREEALVRRARELGLDRDDLIIRRRLIQKMEALLDQLATVGEPTEQELRAWLAEHADRYREPARVSFVHVYFSRARRGAEAAADAKQALAELLGDAAGPPEQAWKRGDPFMRERKLTAADERRVAGVFGPSFAREVMALSPGRWHGPIASSYGEHVVRVSEAHAARLPELADVREQVRRDLVDARREEAVRQLTRELVARYEVRVGESPAEAASAPDAEVARAQEGDER